MRWLLAVVLALAGPAAWSEGIVEVLARSQQLRLDASPEADPEAAASRTIRHSFEALLSRARTAPEVELRVVDGPVVAQTLLGHVIVVNESLANLAEGKRLFILAHELGHVVLGHWAQITRLYQTIVPGEVTPSQTEEVAALLTREASAMAYRQELEADHFGLQMLRDLGHHRRDDVEAFMSVDVRNDTATHPGTRKRLASLRAAETALDAP